MSRKYAHDNEYHFSKLVRYGIKKIDNYSNKETSGDYT